VEFFQIEGPKKFTVKAGSSGNSSAVEIIVRLSDGSSVDHTTLSGLSAEKL